MITNPYKTVISKKDVLALFPTEYQNAMRRLFNEYEYEYWYNSPYSSWSSCQFNFEQIHAIRLDKYLKYATIHLHDYGIYSDRHFRVGNNRHFKGKDLMPIIKQLQKAIKHLIAKVYVEITDHGCSERT